MWNNGQQQGTWWPNYNFQYQANAEGKYSLFGSLSSQGRLHYLVPLSGKVSANGGN